MSPLYRFLLFLSIALVVLVAGLWISGGKKEEYSAKVEIEARASQIYPYLVEPDKLKAWMTGLEQVDKPVPPQDDYSAPPDLTRTVVSPEGRKIRYNDLVIRYTPNETLSIQSTASGTTLTTILQLEPVVPGTTRFSYYVKVSHDNFARLMAPLKRSKLQERVQADVLKLKELVERNEPKLPLEPEKTAPQSDKGDDQEPAETKPAPPVSDAIPDVSGGDQN